MEHDNIVLEHMYLARMMAKKYSNKGMDYEDLVQEGVVGLVKAAQHFDPEAFDNKFSTYAVYWVKQSVLDALTTKSRIIRLPNHIVNAKLKVFRFMESFVRSFGFEPDIDVIAKELKMPKHHVEQVLNLTTEKMSIIDYELGDESFETEEIVEHEDDMKHVIIALRRLSLKERFVMALKFGLVLKV